MGFSTNSGAPIANVPTSPNDTAESLRTDEKGICAVACSAEECPKRSYRAMEVWLLSSREASMEPKISSTVYSVGLFKSTQSLTRILPSVIVPVLSRHRTLTRASISREYISCTSVLYFARRIMPTESATVVSSNKPEGTMPMTTENVF